jgi:hypothetical protein
MKKRFSHTLFIAITLVGLVLSSCTKDFKEINTNPNTITNATPQQLLAPALVNTLTYNMLRNRNFNNELMQVSVNVSDAEGQVFRYDYRSNFSDYLYNGWYSELTNFKDIYRMASDSTGFNYSKTYMGISLICQAWIYSLLTDTYGDVPFSQSNKALTEGVFEPVFDKQKDIYMGIFSMLETANSLLTGAPNVAPPSDPVYGGNSFRWRKFGNSLYLRLLLRLSGKAEVASQVTAKIKDIVEINPSTYPFIASNEESAILRWTGVAPYISPLMTVREQDFRGPGVASFFIDNLTNWSDPRIDISLGTNSINRWGIAPFQGSFIGVPSGYTPGTVTDRKSYFYSNTSTTSLQNDPLGGMIMNYAEVKFILAEAALKGWISSSAETHYNDGVLNGIRLWLPTWNVPILTYLQGNGNDMRLSAATTFDEKMEYIHLQKYYALFLTDLQQWFEYRRTGHPNLPKGPGLRNNGVMPARMTYPVYVQSTNPTNYQAAVSSQGPDLISTQVWWQKP